MQNVEIKSKEVYENGTGFTLQCGKKTGHFWLGSFVNVVIENAAHKVWRGTGKTFHAPNHKTGLLNARENYKSKEVRAMIDFLISEIEK